MITLGLVGVTCLLSYLAWQNPEYFQKGLHYPYREYQYNEKWRILTGGFLHSNGTHLLVNMYMLYMFGAPIEQIFKAQKGFMGGILFLLMYISAIIASSFFAGLPKRNDPSYRSVGASGATSAILFIYILYDPWQMFLFPPLPAIVLAIGFLIYSSWAAKRGRDNIDHMAHYYGAIWGVVFMAFFFPSTLGYFFERLINDFPLR